VSRLLSTAVWHSLPGVVAAYQPIGAPDEISARNNIGAWQRMLGSYTATPGTAPTWSAAAGWTCNGSAQWLGTGINNPGATWSLLVRFSGATKSTGALIGAYINAGSLRFSIWPWYTDDKHYYGNSGVLGLAGGVISGVLGFARVTGYNAGVAEVGSIPTGAMPAAEIQIGRNWDNASAYWAGNFLAASVFNRSLSAAEMWLASRQMAYCEVNPTWNAWARRRNYWIAPAGGFLPAWAQNTHHLLGGGLN
jgi:hypothetical protein